MAEKEEQKKHKTLGEFITNEFTPDEKGYLYLFGTHTPEEIKEKFKLSDEELGHVADGIQHVLKKLINEVEEGTKGELIKTSLINMAKEYGLYNLEGKKKDGDDDI